MNKYDYSIFYYARSKTHSGIRKMRASFTTEIYCLNSCTAFTAYISINYTHDGISRFTFFWHEHYPEAHEGFTSMFYMVHGNLDHQGKAILK